MLKIMEMTEVTSGMTQPVLCRLSDQNYYYAKGRSATPKGLVSEWICAHLGQTLGLPIPNFTLAQIPSVQHELRSHIPGLTQLGFGTAFASLSATPCGELDYTTRERIDPALRRDLAAFDYWISNGDRTLGETGGNPNLFWSYETDTLVVLDHNLAFDATSTPEKLITEHIFGKELEQILNDTHSTRAYAQRFSVALDQWPQIIDTMPEDWLFSDELLSIEANVNLGEMRARLDRLCETEAWGL